MIQKEIAPAAAVKAFARQQIKVQEVTATKTKSEDGKVRPGFATEMKPLAESHVLAARQYADGKIVIVTIDGRRHEARGTAQA